MCNMKKKGKLISVIVPVFNVELYLEKCIKSILGQSYSNLEVIFVDDGSMDKSAEILDMYAQNDSRVRVIHQTNKGPSAARNTGLNICRGDYIGFVDADDWISETMFEILLDNAEKEKADISIVGYAMTWENGKVQKKSNEEDFFVWNRTEAIKEWMTQKKFKGFMCDKLFAADLFQDLRFPENQHYMEDVSIGLNLFDSAKKVVYDGKICYFYLQQEKSITNQSFSEQEFIGINEVEKMLEYSSNSGNIYELEANIRYVSTMFIIIERIINSNAKEYYNRIDEMKQEISCRRKYIYRSSLGRSEKILFLLSSSRMPISWVVRLKRILIMIRRSMI